MTDKKELTILKSAAAVAFPTLLSRILGYVRDYLQAYYLGTSRGADAFTIAYIIPNLLRRLTGEGAMTAAFVPVFTEIKKEKTRKEIWKFANYFFFDLTVVMAALTILGIIFSPLLVRAVAFGFKDIQGKWELTVILTRIMFPYVFLISLAALAMGILNSFYKFFVPAFTPVLLNLAIISGALVFAGKAREPAVVFAVGVVLGGLLQLFFQVPYLWKEGMRFRFGLSFTHPAVRKVVKLTIPGIFGVGIYQINFALSRAFASALEEGSVASLYYASRIQELTLGLFTIALSIALLPAFSEQAVFQDMEGMKKTLSFSLKLIFLITLPAAAGLLVLNRPIIQVLFQRGLFDAHSTSMSASCLFYFALSLPLLSGVKILAPAFFSLKDTKTPVIISFFVMLIYIVFSFILMHPLRVGGIALALTLSQIFNFLGLFFFLERKIGRIEKGKFLLSALKSAVSAALMGAFLWIFIQQFEFARLDILNRVIVLFSAVLLGLASYILLNLVINPEDMKSLKRAFSREKDKGKRG
ncbi:MAG: murein biosynthesis integral membrane protein MurJ [Candidatus Aminicenantales bacterium]